MLFNSIDFAIFLPIVFLLYWFVTKNLKSQNILLLVASYFFYACWDWRFLFLLIFSTLLDYFTGLKMADAKTKSSKKFWFWLSISVNLGFLGLFKYYNFFAESFASAIANFGLHTNPWTLKVILPVGISFYTFHGLSYVIDIYKNRIKPERNFIDYSVFVSFFPLLVAGPIERATHLLPQIQRKRQFDYVKAVELMGASPTPMAFGEVYTSLQTGVIDGYEHDASTTLQQRFYEIAGFMVWAAVAYCGPGKSGTGIRSHLPQSGLPGDRSVGGDGWYTRHAAGVQGPGGFRRCCREACSAGQTANLHEFERRLYRAAAAKIHAPARAADSDLRRIGA